MAAIETLAAIAGTKILIPDRDCRFGRDPVDYLVKGQKPKEEPMETLFPLLAAVIILAALSVGETGARTRRSSAGASSGSAARS